MSPIKHKGNAKKQAIWSISKHIQDLIALVTGWKPYVAHIKQNLEVTNQFSLGEKWFWHSCLNCKANTNN
jgi:hypothetical protein